MHRVHDEKYHQEEKEAQMPLAPPVDSAKSLRSWERAKAKSEASRQKTAEEEAARARQKELKIQV